MTLCRTVQEALDAGYADGMNDPALSQHQVDLIAAILAPHMDLLIAARASACTTPTGSPQLGSSQP